MTFARIIPALASLALLLAACDASPTTGRGIAPPAQPGHEGEPPPPPPPPPEDTTGLGGGAKGSGG